MIGWQIEDQGNADKGCDLCKFALEKMIKDSHDWIIWVQNCGDIHVRTGMPVKFEVYVQPKPGKYGTHRTWYATQCGVHQWQAYTVMQETYAMEVKECEQTERWLSRRNSRI